jgi:hypothetical protein
METFWTIIKKFLDWCSRPIPKFEEESRLMDHQVEEYLKRTEDH